MMAILCLLLIMFQLAKALEELNLKYVTNSFGDRKFNRNNSSFKQRAL
jgi:hypothetical protein